MSDQPRAKFHETTIGVLVVSLLLMVVAGLENGPAPWSPYYIIYIALAIGLPLKWKTYRFGPIRAVPWWAWASAPVLAILLQAFSSVLINGVYAGIVARMGGPERLDDPLIGLTAMFGALFDETAAQTGMSPGLVRTTYLGMLVLWAGYGEELFFRGYVQGTLRLRHSARYAILVAAVLFAVRHYMQMLMLLPKYPVFAATAWVVVALPLGIVLGLIYEKTRSLWIPVAIHYLFNLVPFLLG